MAVGTCADPALFFFPNMSAPAELAWVVSGPAGEFTVTVKLKTDQQPSEAMPPAGKVGLPAGVHALTIVIFFVTACEVKVDAVCGSHKYCRKIAASAGATQQVTLSVVMA